MNISEALAVISGGGKVRRTSWSGYKTYITNLLPGVPIVMVKADAVVALQQGGRIALSPYIQRVADGKFITSIVDPDRSEQLPEMATPWLMTWPDFTATDWEILNEN